MSQQRPVQVLAVHHGVKRRRDEAMEVSELLAGLQRVAERTGRIELLLSDLDRVHRVELTAAGPGPGGYELVDVADHDELLRAGWPDVVHVHLVLKWTHLLAAARAWTRGSRVVFSPMSMLGRDFTKASWFRDDRTLRLLLKPVAVRGLRTVWGAFTHLFVAASEEEVAQAGLPRDRTVLLPLVAPESALAAAILRRPPSQQRPGPDAPVAFLTRFDVQRKGIDRLAAWLDAYRDQVPHPAVRLLAPSDETAPPEVQRLIDEGLIDWDRESRGADVLPAIEDCRAVMLLSRWDGQPRVLREAALFGLPTLSTVSSHFTEVTEVLGSGVVVDGDDPASIQRGFTEVLEHPRRGDLARRLFDRERAGAYLHDVLLAAASRELPEVTRYYDLPLDDHAR